MVFFFKYIITFRTMSLSSNSPVWITNTLWGISIIIIGTHFCSGPTFTTRHCKFGHLVYYYMQLKKMSILEIEVMTNLSMFAWTSILLDTFTFHISVIYLGWTFIHKNRLLNPYLNYLSRQNHLTTSAKKNYQ